MKFMQELLLITEKKKENGLKKQAKAVYHRDYLKTKHKKYRKYHPNPVEEGIFDYMKGAAQHAGQQIYNKAAEKGREIAEPFKRVHAAGMLNSRTSDVQKLTQQWLQLDQQARQLYAKLNLPQNQAQTQPQTEGILDYLGGAGEHIADKTKQFVSRVAAPVKAAHQAGQQRSIVADYQKIQNQKKQIVLRLAKMISVFGPNGVQEVGHVINDVCGDWNDPNNKEVFNRLWKAVYTTHQSLLNQQS